MNSNLANGAMRLARFLQECEVEEGVTIDIRLSNEKQKADVVMRFMRDLDRLEMTTSIDDPVSGRNDRFTLCGLKFRIMTKIGEQQ